METIDFLMTDLLAFGLIFLRMTGFVTTAPFVSERYVPPRFRVLGAILISLILYQKVGVSIDELTIPSFFWLAPMEFGIGAVLGMGMNLVFMAMRSAGSQIGHLIGMRFRAGMTGEERIGIGQLFAIFAAFLIVSSGGDRFMIKTFVSLYEKVPVGAFRMGVISMRPSLELGEAFLAALVKLSLPMIALMITFYFAAGIFQHFFPNWDLFAMIFPGAIIVGIWGLWMMSPNIILQVQNIFNNTVNSLGGVF